MSVEQKVEIVNELNALALKSGVEVVSPQQFPDLGDLERPGYTCLFIDLSDSRTAEQLIAAARQQSGCPDAIIGLDDFKDKIIDLYWISEETKPILIFEDFDGFLQRCDDFDRNRVPRVFAAIHEFWKAPLPHYSDHEACLYILCGEGFELPQLR